MARTEYCSYNSYKLSMLGRQSLKQHVLYERKTLIRKMWTSVFWFLLCSAVTFIGVIGTVETLPYISKYSEHIADLAVLSIVGAVVSLTIFFLLLHHGFRYCLGKNSDLVILKKGGYKVETFYVAGSYRARKTGLGTAGIRMLLEGNRSYVNGTIRGNTFHAVNLTGELIENSYRPCVALDNGSVFVLPRTSVIAPKENN